MANEVIEREQDFDTDSVSYAEAIEQTEAELRDRYEVQRILRVTASCDNSADEWWVKVKAYVGAKGDEQ